ERADRGALRDRDGLSCHNERARVGGLALDTIDLTHVGPNAAIWEKVVRKVRARATAPLGRARPAPAAAAGAGLVSWLDPRLDEAANGVVKTAPTEAVHRLNRTEYRNAV